MEEVILDYRRTTIHPSEYEKTLQNGGYIEIPYLHNNMGANLVYGGRKYKTEKMAIMKSSSPEYDGILLIKHTPFTNGDEIAILAIPLKTQPTVYEETAIDKIINNVNNTPYNFHLGELIGYNKTCNVNDKNNLFILSPILVKSTFDTFNKTWGFKRNTNFRKIDIVFGGNKEISSSVNFPVEYGVEGFTPKNTDYDLYDCEPIIENDSKIKKTIEVMPVTSELAKKMGIMNMMSATIHFFIFLIIVIVSGFGTPFLYKNFFVDYIKHLNISTDANINAASLKMFDYIGTFLLLLFSVGISIAGITISDPVQTSIGGLMAVFILISVMIMIYYKTLDRDLYSFGVADVDITKSQLYTKIIERLLFNKSNFLIAVSVYLVGVIMYYIFGKMDKNKKKNNTKKNVMLTYSVVFGIPFIAYVVSRIM